MLPERAEARSLAEENGNEFRKLMLYRSSCQAQAVRNIGRVIIRLEATDDPV
jgi:hypothetical protein